MSAIHAIDVESVHKIASGQVIVDLQTAVKELVENSIDAGATSIEIRFREFGLKSIEVVDNGSGVAASDYATVALNHHTSKLSRYEDLARMTTFGFRGEALASLCALSESMTITTATQEEEPKGTILEFDRTGALRDSGGKVARLRGTTVNIAGLFVPLPVRRKELSRKIKREFAKALTLLNAYALYPCVMENKGIRMTVSNITETGKKTVQLQVSGTGGITGSISSLWGPKAIENVVPLNLRMTVQPESGQLRRNKELPSIPVTVNGLISPFAHSRGRTSRDRQFFYINGRPCIVHKVQTAINDVYKSFNTTQFPFVVANLNLPLDAYDVNVSPDKLSIFLHHELNLTLALKAALEAEFSPSRSTFDVSHDSQHVESTKPRQASPSKATPAVDDDTEMALDSASPDDGGCLGPSHASKDIGTTLLPPVESIAGEPGLQIAPGVCATEKTVSILASDLPFAPIGGGELPSDEPVEVAIIESSREASPPPRPVKRRRLSSISDSSSSSEEPTSVNKSPLMALPRSSPPILSASVTANNGPLAAISLRASPPSSKRQLAVSSDKVPPKPPRIVSTAKGNQLTLTQTLKGFARPHFSSMDSPRSHTAASDGERDELEMDIDDRNSPIMHPKSPDDMVKLDPPNAAPYKRGPTRVASSIRSAKVPKIRTPPRAQPSGSETAQAGGELGLQIEILRGTEAAQLRITVDFDQIASAWTQLATARDPAGLPVNDPISCDADHSLSVSRRDAGLNSGLDLKAEKALSRIISKDDFGEMFVVGQFNLGFIITRLNRQHTMNDRRAVTDDLFIIDQHAADEKYNFETLQQNTKILCQSLIKPRPLELAASDEVVAVDNLDVLRANGFEVSFTEDAPVGQRLHLTAQPQSKSTVFDMTDLDELLNLMRDQPPGHMVRCSKARSMFASRACRKSVMVGKALSHSQMTSIVRQMAPLDQPWSCPHGRPTMRHLVDLRECIDRSADHMQMRTANWRNLRTGKNPEPAALGLFDKLKQDGILEQ